MRLLEGVLEHEGGADQDELRDENRELHAQLSAARREAESAKRDTAQALGALRKVLTPLYRALQQVFGELEAAGVEDSAPHSAPPRVSAVWESWKSRIPGMPAKVIDALLLHGEMNATQIAIAIGCHRNNVPKLIFKLNKAGLINKNGGRFSLKQL